jgi:hypothetical protein
MIVAVIRYGGGGDADASGTRWPVRSYSSQSVPDDWQSVSTTVGLGLASRLIDYTRNRGTGGVPLNLTFCSARPAR